MPKIVFWPHCYLALRSRSKVGVKVTSQGQRSRSNFWRVAVDIRHFESAPGAPFWYLFFSECTH